MLAFQSCTCCLFDTKWLLHLQILTFIPGRKISEGQQKILPIFIWKAKALTDFFSADFALHPFGENCVTRPPVNARQAANEASGFLVSKLD